MKILKSIILLLLTANFIMAQTTYGTDAGTQGGNYSAYFGFKAGQNATGQNNAFIGNEAGISSTGGANVAMGNKALNENITGTNNIAIGNNAARRITGKENTALGANAGKAFKGDGNVSVGYASGLYVEGDSNVFIGNWAASDQTLVDVSHQLYIENSPDITEPLIYGDFKKGVVAIDTSYVPDGYKLAVSGKVIAEEMRVMTTGTWPDYVFAKDYKLMPLDDLETEIKTLGHLPGVPSAEEVETNGHHIGRMDAILLEKIEELTLHLIDLNKEVGELRQKNTTLENEIKTLKK